MHLIQAKIISLCVFLGVASSAGATSPEFELVNKIAMDSMRLTPRSGAELSAINRGYLLTILLNHAKIRYLEKLRSKEEDNFEDEQRELAMLSLIAPSYLKNNNILSWPNIGRTKWNRFYGINHFLVAREESGVMYAYFAVSSAVDKRVMIKYFRLAMVEEAGRFYFLPHDKPVPTSTSTYIPIDEIKTFTN